MNIPVTRGIFTPYPWPWQPPESGFTGRQQEKTLTYSLKMESFNFSAGNRVCKPREYMNHGIFITGRDGYPAF